jgi:hypothetical protein
VHASLKVRETPPATPEIKSGAISSSTATTTKRAFMVCAEERDRKERGGAQLWEL